MIDPKRIKRKIQDLPANENNAHQRLPGEPTLRALLLPVMPELAYAKYVKGIPYHTLCKGLAPDISISTSTLHRYLTEYVKLHGLPKPPPKGEVPVPLERNKEEKSDDSFTTDSDSTNLSAAQQIRMKHKHLYSQQNNNDNGGAK